MESQAPKLHVVDNLYDREGIQTEPYLIMLKGWLHVQLYEEHGGLKLLQKVGHSSTNWIEIGWKVLADV